MVINREKTVESLTHILGYLAGSLSGLGEADCPDCGCYLSNDQEGCDTCYPTKQILHEGYR